MQIAAHRVALSITMLEACAMTARQRAVGNVVWTLEFARLSTFSHRIDTNVALSSQTHGCASAPSCHQKKVRRLCVINPCVEILAARARARRKQALGMPQATDLGLVDSCYPGKNVHILRKCAFPLEAV
jgi:hypothetical protein